MAISNVALTNTFDEWRVTTNQLIVVTNDLLGDGLTTYRNITANVVTANTLFINSLNVESALSASFLKANTANVIANAAFAQANIANTIAVSAFQQANVANNNAGNSVLKIGDTMTGTLVVPTINIGTTLRATGGTIDTAAANVLSQTLTDATTVSWNASNGQIATITLGSVVNRVILNPTNLRVGTYILHVIQDGSGNRTISTWDTKFKWTQGVAPTLSTAANARDVFSFVCDGTNLYGVMIPDVR